MADRLEGPAGPASASAPAGASAGAPAGASAGAPAGASTPSPARASAGASAGSPAGPSPAHPSPTEPAEDSAALTATRFRRATSRYATGIALVTTVVDGADHAMTANSFTSVSLDPLMALVCVERGSRFHTAVLAGGVWAVSFLPSGAEATARWFATRGRPLAGQFDAVATRRGANGCLLHADALAGLELRTERVIAAGDHDILLARVTAIHDPAPTAPGTGDPTVEPTVYFASRFRHLS